MLTFEKLLYIMKLQAKTTANKTTILFYIKRRQNEPKTA